MSEEETAVRGFIDAINAHDLDALGALMPDDHVFIDSLGHALHGRGAVIDAWGQYFVWFPDYFITVSDCLPRNQTVAVFGSASGTLSIASSASKANWSIPAAWRATVRSCCVAEWQVYADNKPVYDLLAKCQVT